MPSTSGVGTNRWLKYTIEQIPIAPINIGIEQLVNQICSNLDTTIDRKIDDMVCKQYGLDEEEISFIVNHQEDFSKPKIIWKRVGSILRFCYNDNEALGLDSTCFALGNNIEFVCCVLNTPMGHYLLQDAPKTGTGDLLISVQAVEPIKLPSVTYEINIEFKRLLEMMIANCSDDIENEISQKIFNLYGLSHEEQKYIEENFT